MRQLIVVKSQRLVALVGAAFVLAACSSNQTPPDSTNTPAGTEPASHGSLAECLKANGVDESSGPAAVLGPPAGVDPTTWETAMRACSTLAPGPAGP
jgi:hypothetical protein